jgi:subtilisin family serine protease
MKIKFILIFSLICYTSKTLHSQTLQSKGDYVPNQIIVKLKDNFTLQNAVLNQNKTGVSQLFDSYLSKNSVKSMSRVFNETSKKNNTGGKKLNLQYQPENILVVSFKNEIQDIYQSIDELKKIPEVEFAEPNYYYGIDYTFNANNQSAGNIPPNTTTQLNQVNNAAVIPNDPFYAQQQNITLTNVNRAWEVTKGDTITIGVLDTGVDWEHPDLQGNIWVNYRELNGRPGVDDDNNGYIDDIRGWDWINNDNNPTDDNSHGTHVAGIIAARGDNGIGITGVNWYGKIMSLKVMQSTGRGDAVTIARGVEYAAAMGAKILNLSLGGYFESLALKSALEKAYAKCFILAAAGNDAKCIGPGPTCAPLYPSAYSFILGVQDRSFYSNFDQDGPFDSKYSNLLNYDIYAPGTSILSTTPNGSYKSFTGTSMATPLAAGIASLYMSNTPNYDKEFLFGHMINTSSNFIDAYSILANTAKPNLDVSKFEIIDTCANCNNDGKADAGENINLRIYIRNTWAKADSVSFKLEYEPLADKSLVQIINDSSYLGAISPNAITFSLSGNNIRISENVFHDAEYKLNIRIKDNEGNIWNDQIVITFQNAITFGGILTTDVTLRPNKLYYVTENLVVNNCRLTILPGTKLIFSNSKAIQTFGTGVITAIGKSDSTITLTSNSLWSGVKTSNIYGDNQSDIIKWADTVKNASVFKYCTLENITQNLTNVVLTGGNYIRCVIRNCRFWSSQFYEFANHYQNNIYENTIYTEYSNGNINFSNIINNQSIDAVNYSNNQSVSGVTNLINKKINVFNNSFFDLVSTPSLGSSVEKISNTIYFGTIDSLQISRQILDYFDVSNYTALLIKDYRTIPHDSCPGIVWKLDIDGKLMNSYNGKLEDIVEPGMHTFKVYFNRPMDTSKTPIITFGQRLPFNQVSFTNKGVWSVDSLTYTVSREFTITDPKGLVNLNISGAIDNIGMEIPYERTRFRMNLQSTGSKSLAFGLLPLCGKLGLNWENLRTTGSDIIGYNLYRRKAIGNNVYSEFSLLNKELILDNNYVDYKVNLDTSYQYVYTAVRSGMNNETDSSFIVGGIPLASVLADSNGDSVINVLDVVTGVNYILQKEPKPFIFKQSDMNNDGSMNVLDIIGIIDRILNPRVASTNQNGKYDYNSTDKEGEIYLYNIGDTLYARSSTLISGIQGNHSTPTKWLGDLNKWEKIQNKTSGNEWMVYGFAKSINLEIDKPIAINTKGNNPSKWLFSSSSGRPVKVIWLGNAPMTNSSVSEIVEISSLYPNPTDRTFKVGFKFKSAISDLSIKIYDNAGRLIKTNKIGSKNTGFFIEEFDTKSFGKGSYTVVFNWQEGNTKKEVAKQLIKQ